MSDTVSCASDITVNKTVKNPCPHGVHYVRRKQTREQINKIQKICMFNGELWRKVKQKSGLENRWKGCNLYREVREDLAGVTFDERSEEGHRAGAGGRETTRCKSLGRRVPGGLTDKREGQTPRVKGRIDKAAEGHIGRVTQVGRPL